MTNQPHNSPEQVKQKREVPQPVQCALEALKVLEAEDAALAAESRKKLTGFALRLAAAGEEVTVEGLLASARAREIDRVPEPKQKTKTYEEILATFSGGRAAVPVIAPAPVDKSAYRNLGDINAAQADDLLFRAVTEGDLDIVKCLMKQFNKHANEALRIALRGAFELPINQKQLDIAKYLIRERGASLDDMNATDRQAMQTYLDACETWQRVAHTEPPLVLSRQDALFFKSIPYEAVQEILGQEFGFKQHDERYDPTVNQMAFHAAGLFGTQDRVLQYLEKWGTASKYPLHDIIKMIKLPATKTPEIDLTAWGDAVLKCGPSMAVLVKFGDRLPGPQKSDDGNTWSMKNTRAKAAAFVYKKGHENPELAALCMEHGVEEKFFDRALELSAQAPAVKHIPDITIAGEKFGMQGATFRRLATNDLRGLFLGEMTDCCQSISGEGAGPRCAEHGFLSEDSGFYVVENAKGRVVGQTWAWRGKDGELVFDSLETLGKNVTAEQWLKLTEAFTAALAKKPGDVTAFHIGEGGRTPGALTKAFNEAAAPPKPLGHPGYSDSLHQVVVWQKRFNGVGVN